MWAGKDALPDLLKRLKAEDFPLHRWKVIEELGKLPYEESAWAIVEDPSKRTYSGFHGKALRSLGQVAEKPLLQQRDAALRLEMCQILEAIGTEQSLPALEAVAAKGGDSHVTEAAQAAIAAIRGRK
jgi:HEAT repeat protein